MFRIYYHLYCGPSWTQVWAFHRPLLERFAASGLLEKLVVCMCGPAVRDLEFGYPSQFEVRVLSTSTRQVNEFHTLRQMQEDSVGHISSYEYCVYMHSKGASSEVLNESGADWSKFLALSLLGALKSFPRIVAEGYNSLGSNLAIGLFDDFVAPRLHYSGNFWAIKRATVATTLPIELGSRHASVRHNAEWWVGTAEGFIPYNVFATGVDHYTAPGAWIAWDRLELRLSNLSPTSASLRRDQDKIWFLHRMVESVRRKQPVRSYMSRKTLAFLPYHRWPRLFNLRDLAMQALGSNRSAYFYCAESE